MKDPLHFPSQTDGTRTPPGAPADPHNAEAERALLGAILLEPGILPEVAQLLQPADFFVERHTLIYHCMTVVAQKGQRVDMVTLCAELEARRRLDFVGGSGYLTQLLDETPTARGFESYAALIHECALRRRLMYKALDIARIAMHEKDVDARQLGAQLQQELDRALAPQRVLWKAQFLEDRMEDFQALDFVVEGLLPTPSLAMVYGAPGTFKSMLLADLALCVAAGKPWLTRTDGGGGKATRPVPVLWIDFDNGPRRTRERIGALVRGHALPPDTPFYWVSMPTPPLDASSTASINALIAMAKEARYGLIVIDNLGLVCGAAEENTAAMASVMGNLRRLAEETPAAVVVIHHQRKSNGQGGRIGERLRGHSSIEAALDLALLVEREEDSDLVSVRSTKVRDFDVDPFASRWTYTHKADTPALQTAQCVGGDGAEGRGGDAALKRAIMAALGDGPLNKKQVAAKVRAAMPDAASHRIRALIESMIGVELKMTVKGKGAQVLALTGSS